MSPSRVLLVVGAGLVLLPACAERPEDAMASVPELHSLALTWQITEHAPYQSRRPDPPWDRSRGRRELAIDLEAGRFSEVLDVMSPGGYPFHRQVVIDGERSFEANYYDGYRRSIDLSELPSRSAELVRFIAPLVERMGVRAGSTTIELPTGETASIGTSAEGLLEWLEVVLADGTHQRVRYGDYEIIDGIAVNRSARVEANDELWLEIEVEDVRLNHPIDQALEPRYDLEEVHFEPSTQAYEWKFVELAPGVHFVGDTVWHGLFVEREDHLIAIGAVRGAERRLDAVAERFPDKPLRTTVITHHHDDHLEGVPAHAAVGSSFWVSPGHVEITRRQAGAAQVRPVEGKLVLEGSGGPTVRVLQVGPIAHSEEMMVVLIEEPKLLWTADLYVQHPGRPLRAVNPSIRDLSGFLERSRIRVERLVDPHTPKINTTDELFDSLRTEPAIEGMHARSDVRPPN